VDGGVEQPVGTALAVYRRRQQRLCDGCGLAHLHDGAMFAGQRAAEDWMTRCHGCYITLFERKKAVDIAGTMGRTAIRDVSESWRQTDSVRNTCSADSSVSPGMPARSAGGDGTGLGDGDRELAPD
jgi:hypothetical protein